MTTLYFACHFYSILLLQRKGSWAKFEVLQYTDQIKWLLLGLVDGSMHRKIKVRKATINSEDPNLRCLNLIFPCELYFTLQLNVSNPAVSQVSEFQAKHPTKRNPTL